MSSPARLAEVAALIGDPGRAAMLCALIDGRALTARELAEIAGVTPQTASGHLGQMLTGEILSVIKQGRHRYFRLASPEVAALLESLHLFAGSREPKHKTGPRDPALRALRSCYNHLAGGLAVAMTDRLVARGAIELTEDVGIITANGTDFLNNLGLDLGACSTKSGPQLCRPCLDWSERRAHLAGKLGSALFSFLLEQAWLRRSPDPRGLFVTRRGQTGFRQAFELHVDLAGHLTKEMAA